MLQRKPEGNAPRRTYGYLIAVEIEDGETTPEQVAMKLADSLSFVEGVGFVDIAPLGKTDLYEEQKEISKKEVD